MDGWSRLCTDAEPRIRRRSTLQPLTLSAALAALAVLAGCGSLTGPAVSFSAEKLEFRKAETKSITVTNVSGESITISGQTLGESSIFELKDPERCEGDTLITGGSCTYEITVTSFDRGHSSRFIVDTSTGHREVDIETS
jgi:hypothetical protein